MQISTSDRTAPWIEDLKAGVRGQPISPGEAEYDRARTVFYGGVDRKPGIIIRAADDRDVAHVASFARENGLELAVRSGGHSTAGHSLSEGGIVLDLSGMRALEIDVEGRTAWAQAGLTAGEYTDAAGAHGLATGFGDTRTVGLGGLTLGGGVGYLSRKYGLTIDDLMAAEIVTADGQLLRTDHDTHPDLFWAIRGGGGNFGVATRFHYRLHPVEAVLGGMLILPATPQAVSAFVAEAEAAPDELTAIANIMAAPPMPFLSPEDHGRLVILASLAHAGGGEAGERAVERFRAIARPLADQIRTMRYPELYPPEAGDYHPVAVGRTLFMDAVDSGTAETILDQLRASTASMSVVQLRVLGGAVARVPIAATAYAHRGRRIMANVAALYERPGDKEVHKAWADGLAASLRQGEPGAYVNFLGDEGEARVRQAYPGETWAKLSAVKARYDPTNLFRLNQNIPPAE